MTNQEEQTSGLPREVVTSWWDYIVPLYRLRKRERYIIELRRLYPIHAEALSVLWYLQGWYLTWFKTYLVLGMLSIVLPGLAAMDVSFFGLQPRYWAGLGALCVSIFTFIRPHEKATQYDAGVQQAWKVYLDLEIGEPDAQDVVKGLHAAVDFTTLKYSGLGAND